MLRALIIDDETPARTDLRNSLRAHPEVTIVGEAGLLDDARGLLRSAAYDLVFLDVQLLGGTGFDLVPDVQPEARIIFVTAHDEFAVRAFEVNALDYLTKPVRVGRLAETIRRLLSPSHAPFAPDADGTLSFADLVAVKTGLGARRLVRVADLAVLTSEDNYTLLTLTSGDHFLVRQTLGSWDERLPASHFMRVHRRAIVNLTLVEGYEHRNEEIMTIRLATLDEPVRARREHCAELCSRLNALGIRM